MSLLPWPSLLRQAASLGIVPSAFWQVSVAEWRALVTPDPGLGQGMSRANLNQLALRFPDEEIPSNDINEK